MYLIQILLPTTDPSASGPVLAALNRALANKFGGVTAYTQAPAKGNWITGSMEERDDITIIEAMADNLDRAWWKLLRKRLERDLKQKEIVIRCQPMEKL